MGSCLNHKYFTCCWNGGGSAKSVTSWAAKVNDPAPRTLSSSCILNNSLETATKTEVDGNKTGVLENTKRLFTTIHIFKSVQTVHFVNTPYLPPKSVRRILLFLFTLFYIEMYLNVIACKPCLLRAHGWISQRVRPSLILS